MFLLSLALVGNNHQSTDSSKTTEVERKPIDTAAYACRHFIEQTLNDPDSAEFYPSSSAEITDMGGNKFKVIYDLRAKNNFNALVKTAFECNIKLEGGTWQAISVFEVNR